MDGRVGAIRRELDGEGFSEIPILAYSAKFASAFYGPFREAACSAPAFGDRRAYQMDPGNGREAVREALLDVTEGADMVMVKPALAYGDVIAAVKQATRLPVAAYNVSGEYAMVKAAAAAGYLDERSTVLEILTVAAPRRSRHGDHLPRQGRSQMAGGGALSSSPAKTAGAEAQPRAPGAIEKTRSRKDGAAVPLDDDRPQAAEPDAGQLPDRPASLPARRRTRRARGSRGHAPRPAPARDAHHPPGHADLRHARARLLLDARRREGRSRAPAPRGAGDQRASRRLAQLPAQPRLQPVVHDRHRARLEARAGRARSRCSRARRAPTRCASCRR